MTDPALPTPVERGAVFSVGGQDLLTSAAPALARIRDARPTPRSKAPLFYRYWTGTDAAEVPVEDICADWGGQATPTPGAPTFVKITEDGNPSESGSPS